MIVVYSSFSFTDFFSSKCLDLYLKILQRKPEKHSRPNYSPVSRVPTEMLCGS